MFSTSITATTTYQRLSTLLADAGFADAVNQSVTSDSGYLFNRSSTINVSVAAGYSTIPTGTKAVITPIAAILFNAGLNTNTTWIKSASSTATVEFVEGVSAYENPQITGVVGTITLTDDTIPKGDSGNLVDTIIVSQKSGTDIYTTQVVSAVGAGSFRLTLANASGTTTETPVFNFNVIKGIAA